MDTKMYKEAVAAKLLEVSVAWLQKKRTEGGGPAYIKLGNKLKSPVRYRHEDLLDYINSNITKSTSEVNK